MITPPVLQAGDKVALVATARKVRLQEIEEAVSLLRSWQLVPIIGSSIGKRNFQFAGTDEERLEDFQAQIDHPEIKAIWCARGGYGTVRILDRLDFSTFKTCPKWVIGYSDITALHFHLNHLGYTTLHAEMPALIGKKSLESAESLQRALFGNSLDYTVDFFKFNRCGQTRGCLVGGNLSVLYSLCGSPSVPDMRGKILFLEELDEHLYHIDRMMQNLKRNGWFHQINGLVIGGMTDMRDHTREFGFAQDNPYGKKAKQIIADTVKAYDFPVAYNFPAGHLHDNRALFLGADTVLSVDREKARLSFV